jgi:hypothetical protein
MRPEGIIFSKQWSNNGGIQLLRVQVDPVGLRVWIEPIAFDKNVSTSCERGPSNTFRTIGRESGTLGLLELLLPVADSVQLMVFKLAVYQRKLAQHEDHEEAAGAI